MDKRREGRREGGREGEREGERERKREGVREGGEVRTEGMVEELQSGGGRMNISEAREETFSHLLGVEW